MENTLTISEIKRRGMSTINDRLKLGPARIMKRNRPAAVVLSEAQYQQLLNRASVQLPGMSAIQWLSDQPTTGLRSKTAIDADLQKERTASW